MSLTFLSLLLVRLEISDSVFSAELPSSKSTLPSSFERKSDVILTQFEYEVVDFRFRIFSSFSPSRYFDSANILSRKCLYFKRPLYFRNEVWSDFGIFAILRWKNWISFSILPAELLDPVESGLQFRVVAVDLGAKPEIISGIAVSPIGLFSMLHIHQAPVCSTAGSFKIVFTASSIY